MYICTYNKLDVKIDVVYLPITLQIIYDEDKYIIASIINYENFNNGDLLFFDYNKK